MSRSQEILELLDEEPQVDSEEDHHRRASERDDDRGNTEEENELRAI